MAPTPMCHSLAGVLLAATMGMAATQPESNRGLAEITEQDQADRRPGTWQIDWSVVKLLDEQRRQRVRALLKQGDIRTEIDHQNAALVFQHGATVDDIKLAHALAHALALTAHQINPDNRVALWLSAASWDRLLMRMGRPQW